MISNIALSKSLVVSFYNKSLNSFEIRDKLLLFLIFSAIRISNFFNMSGRDVMKASKKQRKGKLISAFLICNLFSCFIFFTFSFAIDSAKGTDLYKATIQQDDPTYTSCKWTLSNPQLQNLNRVILQVSSILDTLSGYIQLLGHITVTDKTLDSIEKIRSIVTRWTSGDRVFPVGDLLQIAYFLNIEPAVLLSAQNLQGKVHIDGLTQRSFMPDTLLQSHLRYINQALREHISESAFQFSLQFNNPNFDLSDLAITVGVPAEDLNQIQSSHFVPHYLQVEQILNAGNNDTIGISAVDFFRKKKEAFEHLGTLYSMFSQLEQVAESMNKVPTATESSIQRKNKFIYGFVRRLKNGKTNLQMETILQMAYILKVQPSIFLTSNNWISTIDKSVPGHFMSDAQLQQLLILINSHLKRKIENSNLTNKGPNISLSISRRSFNNIMFFNKVPDYHLLIEILTQLNISMEEFFQEVEDTDEFHAIFDKNSTEEKNSYIRQLLTTEEKITLKSMGEYLISIIDQNTSTPAYKILSSLAFNRKPLSTSHTNNFRISSLIATHYVMRYSISDIIGKRQLTEQQLAMLPEIRLAKDDRQEYIDKALRALMYLIKRQMQHIGLSIRSLSLKSGVLIATIYTFFQRKASISYLNLLKIVENGFDIPLENFLAGDNVMHLSLEQLIEQFDSLSPDDLNIQVDYLNDTDVDSQVYDNYVTHFKNRLTEITKAIDAASLGRFRSIQLLGQYYKWDTPLMKISTLLITSHVFNVDLATLLIHHEDPSSLKPVNLERLPDEIAQNSLNILAQNIQNEMDARHLTLRDLQLRSGANRLRELEPILNGKVKATYSQLINICKGLLEPNEDPFVLLQRLLNGVSTI